MEFILAANGLHKEFATQCVKSLDALGYKWTMFDLGGLGFGQLFPIQDKTFLSHGHYQTCFKRRPSRALHKPQIIADFLDSQFPDDNNALVVYLDTDTIIRQRIDEIIGDYDIGVTVRRSNEWELEGRINAGVLFLRSTVKTRNFVRQWIAETQHLGNDQEALNSLLPKQSCTIAEFPTDIYNWYYFPNPPPTAKILHYKASSAKWRRPRLRWRWKNVRRRCT
jgi:hypothetical protein